MPDSRFRSLRTSQKPLARHEPVKEEHPAGHPEPPGRQSAAVVHAPAGAPSQSIAPDSGPTLLPPEKSKNPMIPVKPELRGEVPLASSRWGSSIVASVCCE